MHAVERELLKVTGYKVQRKFTDRQDYLKSVFIAVQKLTDDDFDNLSDEAAAWANACVEVNNTKRDEDMPDFDEAEAPEDEDEAASEEEAADEPDEPEDDEPEDDEVEEDDPVAATEDTPEDDEPEEKPKKAPKATKAPKAEKKKSFPKPPKKVTGPIKPIKENLGEVILNKWGCMEGSKASNALAMFEKGTTTKEIKEALGGTYYNILSKMVKLGHKVEKAGSITKLTHKDEVKAAASRKKAVK